jgi:nucleotide-binding universal stress UspA family protein
MWRDDDGRASAAIYVRFPTRLEEATLFKTIVVGIDGGQGGRDAIALARALAAPDATFALAHIYPLLLGRGGAMAIPIEREESQELLQRESALAGLDAELVMRGTGSVGQGLHELAEERGADLLVVGSCRRALLGRVFLGDDARSALNGAPCALAIAPRGYAQTAPRLNKIGVGYDASPESEHALAVARALTAADHAEIKAFWIVSDAVVVEHEPLPANWPRAVEEAVDHCSERLSALEDVHGIVVYGYPQDELASFSKGVELMIVGSRGYGPIKRLFHGSVSHHLIGHCACPLLVLPRKAKVEREGAEPSNRPAAIAAGG